MLRGKELFAPTVSWIIGVTVTENADVVESELRVGVTGSDCRSERPQKKRQRTAALQDAGAISRAPSFRKVLECGWPLPLFKRLQFARSGSARLESLGFAGLLNNLPTDDEQKDRNQANRK